MAILNVREYEHLSHLSNGALPVGKEPALASYNIAIGGASAQGAVLHARTAFVRVNCDVRCSIEFGTDPTALATTCVLSAEQTEYFGVPQSASYRLAVIAV